MSFNVKVRFTLFVLVALVWIYDKMITTASSSAVTLDHLYAKKDELPDESDLFSNSTDFLSTWNPVSAKNWPMFILRGHTYG